jgi:hypothetical protein
MSEHGISSRAGALWFATDVHMQLDTWMLVSAADRSTCSSLRPLGLKCERNDCRRTRPNSAVFLLSADTLDALTCAFTGVC